MVIPQLTVGIFVFHLHDYVYYLFKLLTDFLLYGLCRVHTG